MDPGPRKKSANKIFVGGLHWETTDDKLRKHFTMFGEVTDAVVMKDPVSRRSRGFGFITFADAAAVERVLAQDNHILDSRRVEAKRAVPRSETMKDTAPPTPPMRPLGLTPPGALPPGLLTGPPSQYLAPPPPPYQTAANGPAPATNKIFVGGLHYETKDAEFRQYFENFGRVVSAEVMFNRETHKSRGFGFVVFDDEQSVDNVLATPQHSIDGKLVEVKRAIPRNHTNSPSARGLSPSFTGLGPSAASKGLLGHPTAGMAPTPFALEKSLHRPGMSYASVLQRGGRRQGMDGDMGGLADGMGGLSLRAKQEAQALGLAGPTHWATIEQILESAEGGYPMSHSLAQQQQQLRDQHVLSAAQHQQYYGQGAESAAQAAYLQQPLQGLGLEDYHALHMASGLAGRQPPPKGPPGPSSALLEMGGYPTGVGAGLLSEHAATSRFPFASAGGQSPSSSLLWATPFGQPSGPGDPLDGGSSHPPAMPPQQQAPPPPPQPNSQHPSNGGHPPHPHQHQHQHPHAHHHPHPHQQQGGGPGPQNHAHAHAHAHGPQQLSWDQMLYVGGGGRGEGAASLAPTSSGLPSSSPLSTVPTAGNMMGSGAADYGGAGGYRPSGLDPIASSRLGQAQAGNPGGDIDLGGSSSSRGEAAMSTSHY